MINDPHFNIALTALMLAAELLKVAWFRHQANHKTALRF